jgi:phosphomethylpyrimidine synthase
MKITQDLRNEVAAMSEAERVALEGMRAKSKEFLAGGGQVYLPATS